ncbi:hypothetical protein K2173_017199 [Erythroxylum novogranatense]|uniref:Mce/MlaD domain-containing protein n=1 Tax=Erythroxylum novogranatense TaxID=1862640 RepID=A0AAV8UAA9_9ROSI|nr:hypothetical protein K2173_017199 [Erythroxylum novogranatense]
MVGIIFQASSCPSMLSSSLITVSRCSANFGVHLPSRQAMRVRAMCADIGPSEPPSSSETKYPTKNPLAVVAEVPKKLWRQTLKPLSDFGFGHMSIWEGGVGLFLTSGAVFIAFSLAWLRGIQLRSKLRRYSVVFEFDKASGICTGTPVRIRGVTVGNVIRVNPSLRNIEATVEVEDDKIIIPRNSLVEVNQSGLLMETLIDITPRHPIPTSSVGPLDTDCIKEGLIVCDRQKTRGYQGVSLDELVGIATRLGREMEEIGIAKIYSLVVRVASVVEEAKPLVEKIQAMTEDIQPLLTDVRDSSLLKEFGSLTRSLTHASEDLRKAHTSIMTPENTELIQKSIYSLIFTLKNIENISSDILGFTGDEATRRNLKALIKSLSRLM